MAGDDDEVNLDGEDEIIDGAAGEGTEGQDPGTGDDDSEVSAEQSDASSRADDGASKAAGDGEEGQVTRGGKRFQRLANDNAGLREELAAMRRQREQEAARQAQQEQQWTAQQQQERWNVMTPEEKIEHLQYWGQQQVQTMQQQMGLQMGLMKDQMQYEAKASVNPVYARYKDEVEKQYQEFAQQGRHIPRETLLFQMLGRKAVETASSSTRKAQRVGQKKIEAQTTRPSGSKGDAASTRGKAGDSPEKRLAGVEI